MSSDRNSGLEWGCVPVVLLIIVLWALILSGVVAVVR